MGQLAFSDCIILRTEDFLRFGLVAPNVPECFFVSSLIPLLDFVDWILKIYCSGSIPA